MDWQLQLISVYCRTCDFWKKGIATSVKRYSNYTQYALSDEEAAAIFLFGILSGHTNVRNIYSYADRHLRNWFPALGGYEAFNYRLNRIADGFIALCEHLVNCSVAGADLVDWVVDSLPVILAGPKRSSGAKVAPDMADKGFCSSKDWYFYGVKVHLIGKVRHSTIPFPCFLGVAPASRSDNQMLEQISPQLFNGRLFGDKAYCDAEHKQILKTQNVVLLTPLKKAKNRHNFPGYETSSRWVSSIRQPIESFFNWLHEKTKIQNASKVRSTSGLKVHIFGRIAAALLCLIMPF